MDAFMKRIIRELPTSDRLKRERRAYAAREMARVHKAGDGCMGEGEE